MPQPDRMAGFVQRNSVNIDVAAGMPVHSGIQVHIARNRLRVQGHRIKRVRKDLTGAVERIRISVRSTGELHQNGPRGGERLSPG